MRATVTFGFSVGGVGEVFGQQEAGTGNGFVASASQVVVLAEVFVKVRLQRVVPDEAHATDRALELDALVDFHHRHAVVTINIK